MKKTQIPVFATIALAYRFIWAERRDFINLALVPIVVLAVLDTAVGAGLPAATEAGGSRVVFGFLLLIFVNVVAGVMFAVAWHRRFLVPQESTTFYGAYRLRLRHAKFLFVSIAIGLLVVFAVIVPTLIGALLGPVGIVFIVAAVIVSGLVGARLSVLLPATAVDDLMNFNQGWELAHRNSLRILLVFVLSAIPVGLLAWAASFLLRSLIGDVPSPPGLFVMAFTNEFFGFASAAMGITVLSEAYRILRGSTPSATLPPMPRRV